MTAGLWWTIGLGWCTTEDEEWCETGAEWTTGTTVLNTWCVCTGCATCTGAEWKTGTTVLTTWCVCTGWATWWSTSTGCSTIGAEWTTGTTVLTTGADTKWWLCTEWSMCTGWATCTGAAWWAIIGVATILATGAEWCTTCLKYISPFRTEWFFKENGLLTMMND